MVDFFCLVEISADELETFLKVFDKNDDRKGLIKISSKNIYKRALFFNICSKNSDIPKSHIFTALVHKNYHYEKFFH